MAMLGSVSFLGAGVGHAADGDPKVKLDNKQNQKCSADERNGGLITIGDINLALNVLGIQVNDKSEHKSVKCTQVTPVGR